MKSWAQGREPDDGIGGPVTGIQKVDLSVGGPDDDYVVVDMRGSSVDKAYEAGYALMVLFDGTLEFCVGIGGMQCVQTSSALSTGEWHHIAGVYSYCGSSLMVYFDGGNSGYTSMQGELAGSDAEVWIARHAPDDTTYDAIKVNEFRISTAARYESASYEVPTAGLANDSYTAALWRFDEGIGSQASDASGNGNDLSLLGGYAWFPW